MRFEWDENKNKRNIERHGIDFETALHVFEDEYRIEKYDHIHSVDENRYITIGEVGNWWFVLTVVYTERSDVVRIISAREATNAERREYYDGTI